jgi:acyl dehydratase
MNRTVVVRRVVVEVGSRLVSNAEPHASELHPKDRWFEDWSVGDVVVSEINYLMEEKRMIEFANEFDPQDFHTDPEKAKHTTFGGLTASGWLTGSVMMRQITEFLGEASMGAAGVDEVRWPLPVRVGDALTLTSTVLDMRASESKPDRGIMRVLQELKNQRGEVAMSGISIMFLKTRFGIGGNG